MRGSLLTLTIVNLSWHAMEVSIQKTAVAVRQGITAAALESQAIEPGCLCQSAVVSATVTNGKCLEEVAVKTLKLDHHASEAASSISQRRPPR